MTNVRHHYHGSYWIIDALPATPNAADDEFTTTDTSDPMTGWTTLGTPTVHDMNSTRSSHYYVKGPAGTSSAAQVGIYKAWTPSNGDTWTCKASAFVVYGENFVRCAQFWIAESASPLGKLILLQYVQDGSGPHWAVNSYTAPGTFSANLASYGGARSVTAPVYLRIRYNSSTSIDYHVSTDGWLWSPVLEASNPGFTVAFVGLGVESGHASRQPEAQFDWIRKNWVVGT